MPNQCFRIFKCVFMGNKMCVYGEVYGIRLSTAFFYAKIKVFRFLNVCLWGIKCVLY